MSAQTVSSNDRMMFAIFVALMVHAMLVLGISFSAQESPAFSSTLDVTLAGYRSDEAPEDADFLAQENQQGSGTLDEAQMQTTDVEADFHANDIRENVREEQMPTAPRLQDSQHTQVVSTTRSPDKQQQQIAEQQPPAPDIPDGPQQSLFERSLEIASLQAKLDTERQMYARMPRIHRLTAASTMKATDAYYVNLWRQKIERMGAINYPQEAENCYDNCRLRILVSINPDGSIHELAVLESSGRRVLDEAATRIVRLAAPFAPFTNEMRREMDRLEIIRTWQFTGDRYLSGSN
ncbi:MAG: TonB family protein [Thalassolituus sp.]|jgi:protein TonB|uniref:energy transducer TonB n=1 Tax=unclassified Thalassolituus TaxID=2624967 RepID=UPI000C121E59|nr:MULTISPECIES: TonB family protein [unclassified Thalassolituus]MBN57380.1 energy transducer TonB [Oceanospirillaceae bacterium]MDQ4423698.1 TonB family protein [Thalassolituus sp.]MDQ4425949.1 TonB family protein [Thalassolituus sp.]|tara:strand:+ start:1535 stop:2413 length:879 start_codon:yes stop_codon:yes gene_type:complete